MQVTPFWQQPGLGAGAVSRSCWIGFQVQCPDGRGPGPGRPGRRGHRGGSEAPTRRATPSLRPRLRPVPMARFRVRASLQSQLVTRRHDVTRDSVRVRLARARQPGLMFVSTRRDRRSHRVTAAVTMTLARDSDSLTELPQCPSPSQCHESESDPPSSVSLRRA